MARKARKRAQATSGPATSSVDELLLAALERGDESLETGRYLITFKEGAVKEGAHALSATGPRSAALATRGLSVQAEIAADSPIQAIEPEYFVFAQSADDYLRGFARATEVIAKDLGQTAELKMPDHDQEEVQVIGATWGLIKCK